LLFFAFSFVSIYYITIKYELGSETSAEHYCRLIRSVISNDNSVQIVFSRYIDIIQAQKAMEHLSFMLNNSIMSVFFSNGDIEYNVNNGGIEIVFELPFYDDYSGFLSCHLDSDPDSRTISQYPILLNPKVHNNSIYTKIDCLKDFSMCYAKNIVVSNGILSIYTQGEPQWESFSSFSSFHFLKRDGYDFFDEKTDEKELYFFLPANIVHESHFNCVSKLYIPLINTMLHLDMEKYNNYHFFHPYHIKNDPLFKKVFHKEISSTHTNQMITRVDTSIIGLNYSIPKKVIFNNETFDGSFCKITIVDPSNGIDFGLLKESLENLNSICEVKLLKFKSLDIYQTLDILENTSILIGQHLFGSDLCVWLKRNAYVIDLVPDLGTCNNNIEVLANISEIHYSSSYLQTNSSCYKNCTEICIKSIDRGTINISDIKNKINEFIASQILHNVQLH